MLKTLDMLSYIYNINIQINGDLKMYLKKITIQEMNTFIK